MTEWGIKFLFSIKILEIKWLVSIVNLIYNRTSFLNFFLTINLTEIGPSWII